MNELLALSLAEKENIDTIVDFSGAKVENGNAVIFMEYMKGKKKYKVCHLALVEFLLSLRSLL